MPEVGYSVPEGPLCKGINPTWSEAEDEVSDSYSTDAADDDMPLLSKESDPPSSAGLLEALSLYTDAVQVSQVPLTGLSFTDKALGRTDTTKPKSSVLESPLVTRSLATARRRFLTPSTADSSVQSAPSVSDGAQLAQPAPVLAPYPRGLPFKGPNWLCSTFPRPGSCLSATEADKGRLGLTKQIPSSVAVSEAALQQLEVAAAKGLITSGRMDTVLAALTSALAGGDPDASPNPDRDHLLIKELLVSLSDATKFLSETFAAQYQNAVLLRRDRLLSHSVLPQVAKAEARSLPVVPPFLFGPETGRVVQDAASSASNTLAFKASLKAASLARRPASSASRPRKSMRFSAPARRGRVPSSASRGRRPPVRPRTDRRPEQRSAPPSKGQHPQ